LLGGGGFARFLHGFLLGGLHLSNLFSLIFLGFRLLNGLEGGLLFGLGLLLFIVLSVILLFELLRYVFDEGLENGLHLLAGLPVVHAGVLVQEVVLGLVPLNKELSSEEFSVVESLAEGRSLVLHAGVGLRVENQDRLENAL